MKCEKGVNRWMNSSSPSGRGDADPFETKLQKFVFFAFLSIFWTWFWVLFESIASLDATLFDGALVLPQRVICLTGFVFTCLFCYLGYRIAPRYFASGKQDSGVLVIVLIAVIIVAEESFSQTVSDFLSWPGDLLEGLLLGMVGAIFYIRYGTIVCSRGPRFTMVACAIAVAVSAPLSFGGVFLGEAGLQIVVLVFPLASFAYLGYLSRRFAFHVNPEAGGQDMHTPWRFLVTTLLLSFALGSMQGIVTHAEQNAFVSAAASFGLLFASLLAYVTVFRRNESFNTLIYQRGFPVMALGFLLVAMGATSVVCYLLCVTGYRFTELVIWSLYAFLATTRRGVSSIRLFSLLGLLFGAGQAIGLLFADGLIVPDIAGVMPVMTLAMLLFSGMFLVTGRNLYESWGVESPTCVSKEEQVFNAACLEIAQDRGLTERERDVFMLLARGHNRESVATDLVLSKDTIKTHAKNIFAKLEVHTQQELIGMVEAKVSETEESKHGML